MAAFQLEFWHWWALSLGFVVIEGMFPVGIFAGVTVAAGVTGALLMTYGAALTWTAQLGIFAGITSLLSPVLYFLLRKNRMRSETATIKAQAMVGKTAVLTVPVQNGFGNLEIDGVSWEVKGPNMKIGTEVRVVAVDADMLVIVPIGLKRTPSPAEN